MPTPRLPLTESQETLPKELPRHLRRRISLSEAGCWLVSGSVSHHPMGYQSVSIDNRSRLAHRLSYEVIIGPIPEGLTLDHLCRVTNCVNPQHLEPVTAGENTLRGTAPSALNARKDQCKSGHDLTGENLYIRPDNGKRQCRRCQVRNDLKRKAKVRTA